jgi:GT2 family glycosyltransferase
MAPVLSIVIVSYNTRDMTVACLDSIVEETRDTPFEIILLDNASTDGSAEAVAKHAAKPRIIALDENIGFAGGNNLAAKSARGELLLLLNPDTVIKNRAVDRLVEFARKKPEAMIWGGRTVFADGRLNPSSAWGQMTTWRLFCRAAGLTGIAPHSPVFNGEAIGGWARDSEREVDIVSGCLIMMPAAFWRRLGGFDPVFFMYGEEADLCLRARNLGARPMITPDATIVHFGGASEATREGKMVKLLAAKSTLIIRHLPSGQRSAGLMFNKIWPLGRWLLLALIASLTGHAELRAKADVWRAIWLRRREWKNGYRKVDAVQTGSPAGIQVEAGAI